MNAALGLLAATCSITLVWPQVWLSCRRGRTRGLSATGTWLAVALNLCWLAFGLLTGDPTQVVTNAVVGAGNTAVLAALLLTQPHLRSRPVLLRTAAGAAGLAALAAGSVAAVVLTGASPAPAAAALGVVTSLVGALSACVQPLALLRDRTQDLSGLSPTRWWLTVGSGGAWAGYVWLQDQPSVWASASVGFGCALVVCGVLVTRRPERSALAVRPRGTATPSRPVRGALATA
jgi:uncharacterized protein with PQ loop repeat